MTIALISLGCPKNLVDSEVMLGLLQAAGHTLVAQPERAEAIILNTCAFIQSAREEALAYLDTLAPLRQEGPCRRLIVAGCLPRRLSAEELAALPGVDAFVGPDEVGRIPTLLTSAAGVQAAEPHYLYDHTTPRLLSTPPWTAYLKVAEGCSHRCAFCSIPAIRGAYRSRQPESVLEEARALARRGVRELILIAQDTSAYGVDLARRPLLPDLLTDLAQVQGLDWLRLMYTYPAHVTDDLLAVMAAHPRICAYLDLPLQHSHPDLLRAMRRPGDGERYLAMLAKVRQALPGVTLRTSLIVGLPGETEARFRHLQDFVRAARFDRLGVFPYSPEPGTPACYMPGQVPAEMAQARYHTLMRAQQQISLERNRSLVGSEIEVLVEHVQGHQATGRSRRDAPDIDGQVFLSGRRVRPGDLVRAVVTAAEPYDLYARVR